VLGGFLLSVRGDKYSTRIRRGILNPELEGNPVADWDVVYGSSVRTTTSPWARWATALTGSSLSLSWWSPQQISLPRCWRKPGGPRRCSRIATSGSFRLIPPTRRSSARVRRKTSGHSKSDDPVDPTLE